MDKLRLRRSSLDIVQNCWVVPDLHAAMRKWLDMGYGPFLTFDMKAEEVPDFLYRGKGKPVDISVAVTQGGAVQIELIQQTGPGQSVYRDMYGPDEGGFHHVCIFTDDYPAELARFRQQGIAIAAEGKPFGVDCCFADTRESMGCMLEVLANAPVIHQIYKNVADAAKDWDGSHPIRPFKFGSDPILPSSA